MKCTNTRPDVVVVYLDFTYTHQVILKAFKSCLGSSYLWGIVKWRVHNLFEDTLKTVENTNQKLHLLLESLVHRCRSGRIRFPYKRI